ncbi:MAG: hypothetical protein A2Y62_03915 [Candidatus Fischerbacteria bacterium RBG_13_37_8]|uniref:Uncharacterized protein n=1 Tax=Candidatus Fischerbacteria bacterium RBG_13_37_8 TaxID=1817863 RepID=A0A1F5V6W8_9BACT|nr:MAG: hypothetical protein A2Y62_03915 [Candidatus Fischerbacteria bacterium RBG_13_37_8]
MSQLNESAVAIYLFAIGEKLFPRDEEKVAHLNGLIEKLDAITEEKEKQQKMKEIMEYVMGENSWTKERYKIVSDLKSSYSIEQNLTLLQEIKAKAKELDVQTGEYEKDFNKLIEFYQKAAQRTFTIVDKTMQLYNLNQGDIIPLSLGAAHTERAITLLKSKEISYVVIKANSFSLDKDPSFLSVEAYQRKHDKLSVDDKGLLGSFLDTRWKPPIVLERVWFKQKSELIYITTIIAREAASGGIPPFDNIKDEISKLNYITIDKQSLKIDNGEVIFKVMGLGENRWTIWVRAAVISPEKQESLEERIKKILDEVKKNEDVSKKKGELEIKKVANNTIAAYSSNRSAIMNIRISG